jgi:hypothetical protein
MNVEKLSKTLSLPMKDYSHWGQLILQPANAGHELTISEGNKGQSPVSTASKNAIHKWLNWKTTWLWHIDQWSVRDLHVWAGKETRHIFTSNTMRQSLLPGAARECVHESLQAVSCVSLHHDKMSLSAPCMSWQRVAFHYSWPNKCRIGNRIRGRTWQLVCSQ